MPSSLADLVDLLDLEPLDVTLFRGRRSETMLQRVFGGQVAGQALAAASATVEPARSVHSLHAYFLLPGDPTHPILYDVEQLRDGRSFTTRRVIARQHGKGIFAMTASFQVPEDGLDHQDEMPEVPAPEDLPTLGEALERISGKGAERWAREFAALDVRVAGDSGLDGSISDAGHPAISRVWLRADGVLPDDPRVHASVLTYASDLTLLGSSLVPHGVVIGDPRLQTASLDHAMWFHRDFRADDWLLYDQVSPSASGGRGLGTGRLFGRDGRLVASVVQEGLIRRTRE